MASAPRRAPSALALGSASPSRAASRTTTTARPSSDSCTVRVIARVAGSPRSAVSTNRTTMSDATSIPQRQPTACTRRAHARRGARDTATLCCLLLGASAHCVGERVKPIRPKHVDLGALKLTPPEYFVLSRVQEPLTIEELVVICGLQKALVREVLAQLAEKGALDVDPSIFPKGASDGPSLVICGASDRGVVRSHNEDAFAVVELDSGAVLDVSVPRKVRVGTRGVLLVVCDGMGGENAGEVASALAVDAVREGLATSTKDPAADLARAVLEANARVLAAANAPGRAGMGATLVAVLVTGAAAYTAEVGDSRAYAVRRGVATPISKDQTYVRVLLEQGLLTPETVAASQARNVVLQAIGKAEIMTVAQRRLAL